MAGTAAFEGLDRPEAFEPLDPPGGRWRPAGGPLAAAASPPRPERLRRAVDACRIRYGPDALRTGVGSDPAATLSTGIPALDRLTGVGGLPLGRVSLLEGPAGAGTVALGLVTLAAASRDVPVALVDFTHAVDPADLVAYAGTLERLWVVRPRQSMEGWAAVRALVRAGVRACLAVAGPLALAPAPAALLATLAETLAVCTVVGAGPVPAPWRVASSLTLACAPRGWWWVHGDIAGSDLVCTVAKHRCGPAGGRLGLRVRFPRPYPPGAGVEALDAEPGAG